MTIEHNNKINREQSRLSVLPIFDYKINFSEVEDYKRAQHSFNTEKTILNTDDDVNNLKWDFNLEITNIGIGHAKRVETAFHIDDNKPSPISLTLLPHTELFFKGDVHTDYYSFIIPKKLQKNEYEKNCYDLYITLYYEDLLNNRYEQTVNIILSYSTTTNKRNNKYDEIVQLSDTHIVNISDFKILN